MTLVELDEKITESDVVIKEKQSVERKLNEAMKEYNALKQKKIHLTDNLKKERKDIEKLESTSIVNLWFSVIGSKREKIMKEQEELSQAEHNYKMTQIALEQIEPEIKDLQDRLDTITKQEIIQSKLIKEKETVLMKVNVEAYEPIVKLNEKIVRFKNMDQQFREAEIAGNKLKQSIKKVMDLMKKAKNWGTFDLLGGGLLANISKHSYIGKAEDHIRQLQHQASKFTRELKDVDYAFKINIDISDSLKFADYLFDGLFVDLTVQSRINDVLHSIQDYYTKIELVTSKLRSKRLNNMKQLKIVESNKQTLIKSL
ncbi:hypothetical protein [Haloplasma contractile]|uniref:Uncharacterized protein n=1 Tax=Haloplasma contractile SSD-17B TaxID=1033810 RepID=U2EG21_9MOLU|nr:hypothetical protein [Haloplasma contractile]ERJ13863.1 hypothetical protein HLPCO_000529 [Haloplasma contractile SSD-17B]